MTQKSATVVPFQGVETWKKPAAEPSDRWHPVATVAFVVAFNGLAWAGIVGTIAAIV